MEHGILLLKKEIFIAEIIINAGGLWAREVGKLAGLHLPVQPMEHHYVITESIPEIEARGNRSKIANRYRF